MLKGFLAGLVIANGFEWFAHKYILHGIPRKGQARYSPVPQSMRSHWEHHREVRKTAFSDHGYVEGWQNWRTRNEIGSLVVVASVFGLVFYPVSKGMSLAVLYSACNYYYVHRRAHLEPEWAKRKIPWHYDHHMNSNQDANWCVTRPWFDYVMGTRVISSPELQEQNPLGIYLPKTVSQALSSSIQQIFPAKWVEKNRALNP
ncbi:sterol desaturase family protein [Acinetobacter schindleri]|uniref:Sterol desaturase family protein n=1 Tax=Acinetobacter schindleri TaxID=108981 RepID=A0AAE6WYD1_9GAMM|nr:sterol desaturase family protein [Acinetobacter schindleri]QIC68416.1 sterol desaturase family protein [Acinetobacter schindleri]UOH74829.1 sterol desaturase family protein [Acinetobacter schindleri]